MPYAICSQGKPVTISSRRRCPSTPCTQGQAVEAWLRWKHNERNLPDGCKPCQVAEAEYVWER